MGVRPALMLAAVWLTLAAAANGTELRYDEIASAHKTMTDAEWKKYEDWVKGRHACWTGSVMDVDKHLFGGYQISVDMDHNHVADTYLKKLGKEAGRYRKGDPVSWCGTIETAHRVFGLSVTFQKPTLK
jgi:hypothetical protein